MKKTLLALALAAGLTSFAGSAKAALTYNWSFNNDYTYGSGWGATTTGSITGTVDQGGAFSPVSATYSSGDKNGTFDFSGGDARYVNNSLYVLNSGILQGGFRYSFNNYAGLTLNSSSMMGRLSALDLADGGGFTANFSGASNFVPVSNTAAVPEPSQVAASLLLAAGIAGFVIVKRRKECSETLAA